MSNNPYPELLTLPELDPERPTIVTLGSSTIRSRIKEDKPEIVVEGPQPSEDADQDEAATYMALCYQASEIYIQVVSTGILEKLVEFDHPHEMCKDIRTEYYWDTAFALVSQITNLTYLSTSFVTTWQTGKGIEGLISPSDNLTNAKVKQRLLDLHLGQGVTRTQEALATVDYLKQKWRPKSLPVRNSKDRLKECTWCRNHHPERSKGHTWNACFRLKSYNQKKEDRNEAREEAKTVSNTSKKVTPSSFYYANTASVEGTTSGGVGLAGTSKAPVTDSAIPSVSQSYRVNRDRFSTDDTRLAWMDRHRETANEWYGKVHLKVVELFEQEKAGGKQDGFLGLPYWLPVNDSGPAMSPKYMGTTASNESAQKLLADSSHSSPVPRPVRSVIDVSMLDVSPPSAKYEFVKNRLASSDLETGSIQQRTVFIKGEGFLLLTPPWTRKSPDTYAQAQASEYWNDWIKVINEDITLLEGNQVWEIVDRPVTD
ncbi:hypothetical protein HOY80DRAFT_1114716 [Tuber brumale]|nr:hypothetical protein HOY80DRAFT_1114716 [Tuber brumale]